MPVASFSLGFNVTPLSRRQGVVSVSERPKGGRRRRRRRRNVTAALDYNYWTNSCCEPLKTPGMPIRPTLDQTTGPKTCLCMATGLAELRASAALEFDDGDRRAQGDAGHSRRHGSRTNSTSQLQGSRSDVEASDGSKKGSLL